MQIREILATITQDYELMIAETAYKSENPPAFRDSWLLIRALSLNNSPIGKAQVNQLIVDVYGGEIPRKDALRLGIINVALTLPKCVDTSEVI